MDSEVKSILISVGLLLLIIEMVNALLLWKCKPYREFMNGLFFVCNPHIAATSLIGYVISPETKQEDLTIVKKILESKTKNLLAMATIYINQRDKQNN